MRATLPLLEATDFPAVSRGKVETLQVNLGYRCNQQCVHCHVNAGPRRREIMAEDTVALVLEYLERSGVRRLDLTGGAPELNPHFRELVSRARALGVDVMDRCNLTILEEPGQTDLADFLAAHHVEVTASLPCYLRGNVDKQRGKGVYDRSIRALARLNGLGYGQGDPRWRLNLVYNPLGAFLPPCQAELERDYKRELNQRYRISFDHLFTLVNMPIQRFGSMLVSTGRFDGYMRLLREAHRDENLDSVMCRNLISVDWEGYLYDCDFNQMLGLPMRGGRGKRMHLSERMAEDPEGRPIAVGDHCYGCTAGQGSSCGGALSES